MKKLVLAAVAMAPGCIFVSNSTGHIQADWGITIDGVAGTCGQAGNGLNVEIVIDGPTSDDFTVPCDTMVGTSIALDTGTYTVSATILDSSGTGIETETATLVSVTSGNTTDVSVTFPFSSGTVCGDGTCDTDEDCSTCPSDCGACTPVCGDLSCNGSETCDTCPGDCDCSGLGNWNFTWEIMSTSQGAIDCATAGATIVSFVSTSTSGGNGNDDQFTCSDLAGASDHYLPDTYTVVPALCSGSQPNPDCTLSAPTPVDSALTAGQTTDFPLVIFQVP